jgi:uncharacterized coiled-coil protein SlyX
VLRAEEESDTTIPSGIHSFRSFGIEPPRIFFKSSSTFQPQLWGKSISRRTKVDSLMVRYIMYLGSNKTCRDTNGGCMSEKRFTQLETMVTYHEDTIQKLNDVIYKQQIKIEKLEEKIDAMVKLMNISESVVGETLE